MYNISFREVSLQDGYKEYEFFSNIEIENENGFYIKKANDFVEFREILKDLVKDKNIAFTEQRVPQIVYWVVLNDDIIGIVKVRKIINENLKKLGGHIGYYILKKYRNKGYGKELLKRALDLFDDNTTIVITCSKDNLASQKVIEYNNGILIEILNDRCIYNIEK